MKKIYFTFDETARKYLKENKNLTDKLEKTMNKFNKHPKSEKQFLATTEKNKSDRMLLFTTGK